MNNFREIIAWILILVVFVALWVITHNRHKNDSVLQFSYIFYCLKNYLGIIFQIVSSSSVHTVGEHTAFVQKIAGSSDKKSGICNSIRISEEIQSSIKSLNSGACALYLYIFFSPVYNSNICTVKYKTVFHLLKPCAL